MIIPPPYAPALAKLKPGQFAIPELKWTTAPVGLALAKLGPFRAMFTTVSARGFAHVTKAYLPHVASSAHLVAADINILESGILADINAAIKGWRSTHPIFPTDAELIKIAVGIQLWGANTGRHPFINGAGFLAHFSVNDYRKIITYLLSLSPASTITNCPHLPSAVGLWKSSAFRYFGVSFATKHFSFWSQTKGMPTSLPIYDNIVANKFMGRCVSADWGDYVTYVKGMHEAVSLINAANPHLGGQYSVIQLERQLFNWANTPAADDWTRCPVGPSRSTRTIRPPQAERELLAPETRLLEEPKNMILSKKPALKNNMTIYIYVTGTHQLFRPIRLNPTIQQAGNIGYISQKGGGRPGEICVYHELNDLICPNYFGGIGVLSPPGVAVNMKHCGPIGNWAGNICLSAVNRPPHGWATDGIDFLRKHFDVVLY
jgi:hypothetical protein